MVDLSSLFSSSVGGVPGIPVLSAYFRQHIYPYLSHARAPMRPQTTWHKYNMRGAQAQAVRRAADKWQDALPSFAAPHELHPASPPRNLLRHVPFSLPLLQATPRPQLHPAPPPSSLHFLARPSPKLLMPGNTRRPQTERRCPIRPHRSY